MADASNKRPLVYVTDFIPEPLDIERGILGDLADVVALNARSTADFEARVQDAAALMVYHFLHVHAATIQRLPSLKIIVRCGAGFDNVDGQFARSRGIDLTNVPDYGTEDVADTAIAMALTIARGTHRLNHLCQREDSDWTYGPVVPLNRIRGQVFGIIGLGCIGTATAQRAKAFGFNVVFYDPYVSDGFDKALGIRRAETIHELMKQSNVVSCHCLLSDETRHIVNRDTIELLPDHSIIVNTARGAVVDAEAILEGLESGKLLGAGLDVLEEEPPTENHPVLKAWRDPNHPAHTRLVLTPHAAFYSQQGLEDMRRKGAENVRRMLLGQPLRNVVN